MFILIKIAYTIFFIVGIFFILTLLSTEVILFPLIKKRRTNILFIRRIIFMKTGLKKVQIV